ncbi:PAS domain-containing protein [Methanomicrobium antiquum]|uniref:PAS domain-containing protein n=1 Tax=Methanomicrobium antiquum TaxID=487686 RepID=A0AAF0FME7_9EURY|nr:PAS domain-containing protein [Methanomicrobium antiquum]WFN37158.1 PAS domain-containing protein [Methanomicrobium antiquum]
MAKEKILITDDEVSNAIKIRNLLRNNNYEISGLSVDAFDTIQQAGANKPDLVIMRIGISGSAGIIDAASKIIENYKIPVLFIIGESDLEVLEIVKKLNNPVVVLKPFTDEQILKSIDLAINRHKAEEKSRINKTSANTDPAETGLMEIPAAAITINKRGAVTRINKEMEFLTGFNRNKLIGRKFLSLIDTEDESEREDDEVCVWPDKVLLKKADGNSQKVSVLSGFIKSYGDNFDEQILIFKKETGEVSFASKDIDVIFTKVLNSLDDIVFVISNKMEITHYNQKFFSFARRLSISKLQLTKPAYEIPQFSKIASVNIYEELFKNGKEVKHIRKYGNDKETTYMLFHFIPLETDGIISHMITVMRDITEIEESRQKSGAIHDEFLKNSTLMKNIQSSMSDIRTALYQIVKFVEKNPEKLRDPAFKQVAVLSKNAEKKLIIFDRLWSRYETQLNMIQMNVKYKFNKK